MIGVVCNNNAERLGLGDRQSASVMVMYDRYRSGRFSCWHADGIVLTGVPALLLGEGLCEDDAALRPGETDNARRRNSYYTFHAVRELYCLYRTGTLGTACCILPDMNEYYTQYVLVLAHILVLYNRIKAPNIIRTRTENTNNLCFFFKYTW